MLLTLVALAHATDHYADPVNGSVAGDGTASFPWGTLEQVIAAGLFETQAWDVLPYEDGVSVLVPSTSGPIAPGDTLFLRSGFHGDAAITSAYNAAPITIAAEQGQVPTLSHLQIQSGSNWVLRGLSVSPSYAAVYGNQTIVSFDSHSWTGPVSDIVFEDSHVFSVPDVSAWTEADWNALSATGISVDGRDMTVQNNQVSNVNFGISVTAAHSLIDGNVVENFAGDGLRGLGDYTTFQYNTVKNAYDVNDNHDDGFQSWSVGEDGTVGTGEVTGLVLRGNTILNYTDEDQPFRGPLQGIGCFDGTFVDWVIENNVIVTDHWHGITLLGARNVVVVNNTVVDLNEVAPGPPWISVAAHKDGTPTEGCLVRNNLSTGYASDAEVDEDHNLMVDDLSLHFVSYPDDLHLLPTSPAVDAGTTTGAPPLDADGVPRPWGAEVDAGAYEFFIPEDPVDGGGTTAPTVTSDPTGTDGGLAPDGPEPADPKGCGCASTGPPLPWLLLLPALLRRRRAPSRA